MHLYHSRPIAAAFPRSHRRTRRCRRQLKMAKPKRPAHKKTKITKTNHLELGTPAAAAHEGRQEKGFKHAARDLTDAPQQQAVKKTVKKPHTIKPDTYVALDCEMVGVGSNEAKSALARCSVVDEQGKVLYDRHVQVDERVTDFRTKYSGVRAKDLKNDSVVSRLPAKGRGVIEGQDSSGSRAVERFEGACSCRTRDSR